MDLLKMALNKVMDSLGGKMDPIIKETILKGNEMEKENFLIQKIKLEVEVFGKRVH